jgi:hypothetical protein
MVIYTPAFSSRIARAPSGTGNAADRLDALREYSDTRYAPALAPRVPAAEIISSLQNGAKAQASPRNGGSNCTADLERATVHLRLAVPETHASKQNRCGISSASVSGHGP